MSPHAPSDEAALTRLYDDCSPRVFGLIRRVVGDRAIAERVFQDVFLDVWQQAATAALPDEGRSEWVLAAAHDRAVSAVRSRRDVGTEQNTDAENTEHLGGALHGLPDDERLVIELAYLDGFTQGEIASITRTSLAEVKRITRGAVSRLQVA